MKSNRQIIILVALAIFLVSSISAFFVIPEGRQAVITQFGKPIRSVKKAGLHIKAPFIQDIRMIDLRILSWDGHPNQIPTKDKKYIEVDTTARWRITDPLKFIQTVQNEQGARSRLDAILDGVTRDVISNNDLVETVRNSNTILEVIEQRMEEAKERQQEATDKKEEIEAAAEQEEIAGEVEKVDIGREKLSQLIVNKAHSELKPLGVELIDVQLKRITYEDSVQKKVYARMISERQRIAEKIRSYGKGEKAKIEGITEKDLKEIQSNAYKKVQKIKGEAEGKAIAIYAKALGRDPKFFRFTRSLEAYEKSLPSDSRLILSTKSKFWEVMDDGG